MNIKKSEKYLKKEYEINEYRKIQRNVNRNVYRI